jgi:lysozyme
MTYSRARLMEDLELDEDVRLKPYRDSVGKLTIGVGRNLDDMGISPDEAQMLLEHDITKVERDLDRNVPWWRQMTEPRQRALLNMCFNLGWPKLAGFKQTLGYLEAGQYAEAATACLDSLWARQVGARAERIATLFRGVVG